jgi:L-alanine-DL-glutamate epimerase-like enolase superfamily enzyme
MKIRDISLSRLLIPFRSAFEHASARRERTETLWARVETEEGAVGIGEGCPRSYVTGEGLASGEAFFTSHRESLLGITSLSDLTSWVRAHRDEVDRNPAAWCAVELALLDALGRAGGMSVERLLGLDELHGEFRYTAVLGIEDLERFRQVLSHYRALRMTHFKLKLSGDLDADRDRVATLCASGEVQTLRLDANNLWKSPKAAAAYVQALAEGFSAVEEPLAPNRYWQLARLSRKLGIPIVLDESFRRREQLETLLATGGNFIVNVRLSKMGGLLRSLDVVRAAKQARLPMVIGAQVGETSVLTRAALPVAQEAGRWLVGQEGAFGTRLLAEDAAEPSLMFGEAGALPAPVSRAGLGLSDRDTRKLTRNAAGMEKSAGYL